MKTITTEMQDALEHAMKGAQMQLQASGGVSNLVIGYKGGVPYIIPGYEDDEDRENFYAFAPRVLQHLGVEFYVVVNECWYTIPIRATTQACGPANHQTGERVSRSASTTRR